MGAIYAELHVAGRVFVLRRCTYGVSQATGPRGRPIEQVRHSGIDGEMDVPRDQFMEGWAAAEHMPLDGHITFSNGPGEPVIETVSWTSGQCVGYGEVFNRGSITDGSYICRWRIVAAKLVFGTTPQKPFVAAAPREHGTPPVAAPVAAAAAAGLSKQQRYDARMKKLAAARAQLAATEPARNPLALPADATRVAPNARLPHALPDYDRLQAATERLARNNVAVERAKLADDSYNNEIGTNPDGTLYLFRRQKMADGTYAATQAPDGWEVDRVIKGEKSGFMAVVYTNTFERPPRPVVVFRGTDADPNFPDELKKDGITDAMQGIGLYTDAFKQTEQATRDLERAFPKGFDIAGHSLGGAQASLAGLLTGHDTYTFNGAGLHEKSMRRAGITSLPSAQQEKKIHAYYSDQDPLSWNQDHAVVPKTLVKVVTFPLKPPGMPNPLVPLLDDPRTMPSAIGTRYRLKDGGGHWSPAMIDGAGHSVPPMVMAIEKQKDEDLATIAHLVPAAR